MDWEWNSGRDGDWNRFEVLLEMGGMCVILVVEGNSDGDLCKRSGNGNGLALGHKVGESLEYPRPIVVRECFLCLLRLT